MITAKYALDLKRDLFVVPGAVTSMNYKGSNNLLVQGAKCILNHKDILKNYKELYNEEKIDAYTEKIEEEIEIPKEYLEIYKNISDVPKNINQIAKELEISISILSCKLTMMEMEGFIKCMPGKFFIRCF